MVDHSDRLMADRPVERNKPVVRIRGVRVGKAIISPPSLSFSHRPPPTCGGPLMGTKRRWAVRTSQWEGLKAAESEEPTPLNRNGTVTRDSARQFVECR
ncbi:hypothetical protein LZ32DRAFT_598256 [Colletotrichum eremochloae]|nr:hypothetical protein LZ32DRAFT_598256 [Colletotrichum eremochloae]